MKPYPTNLTIKSWAEEDRPREKLLAKGRQSLSDAELIAILIGSGSKNESAVDLAKKILNRVNNSLNELGKLTVNDLMQFKGIGEAKAISIVSALEIGRRRKEEQPQKKIKIASSKDVFDIFHPILSDLPHEEFWILLLSKNNQVKEKYLISRGGISGTVTDVRIIFKYAIEHLASAMILCHNHPSGNMQPSQSDIHITRKLQETGKLMEIPILDHVIIGDSNYYSFADEGLM